MWLDDYIEFSRKWSPRAYDFHHEACGIALLSGIAAKRVAFNFGGLNHTQLYVVLVGDTSIFTKSTTLKVVRQFMEEGGFSHRLLPNNCTPQRLITLMSSPDTDAADELLKGVVDIEIDDKAMKELLLRGQRFWIYDEFGQNLAHIVAGRSAYADFLYVLREFDDDTGYGYGSSTQKHGDLHIKDPYLTIVACITPADVRRHVKKGAALWSDGYLARFAFVAPPTGTEHSSEEFPRNEEKVIPHDLLSQLVAWDKRLSAQKEVLEVADTVWDYRLAYDKALGDMIDQKLVSSDLYGNLSKLPIRTFRIAALLASVSGSEVIASNHWIRAQAITEHWQEGLVNLYQQISEPDSVIQAQEEASVREKVLEKIRRFPGITEAALLQRSKTWLVKNELSMHVADLLDDGETFWEEGRGGVAKYYYAEDYELEE